MTAAIQPNIAQETIQIFQVEPAIDEHMQEVRVVGSRDFEVKGLYPFEPGKLIQMRSKMTAQATARIQLITKHTATFGPSFRLVHKQKNEESTALQIRQINGEKLTTKSPPPT